VVPARGTPPVAVAPPPPPSVTPDLTVLLADEEARVRRRAALAVGRVGLGDGVEPLLPLLGDADPEVQQMAAFALGLIVGALGMVPRWWKHRVAARRAHQAAAVTSDAQAPTNTAHHGL